MWVRDEHDIATQDSRAVTIARAADLDEVPLLVDLGGVTFVDASIVGALVGSKNRLRSRFQTREVRAPSPPARRLLRLCGLAHLVHRGPIQTTGVADALGTWVEVLLIEVTPAVHQDRARVTEPTAAGQPDRLLAAAKIHIQEAAATVGPDPGGP